MRSRFSQLLEWRWAPCAGLVLGSGAFVVLAVALIPDHFAEVSAPGAAQLTLPAPPAQSPAPAILGVRARAAASDTPSASDPSDSSDPSSAPSPSERHARRRLHRTLAASAPSTNSDSVSSFFPEAPPEALPPPLPDTPPPPEPPASTATARP